MINNFVNILCLSVKQKVGIIFCLLYQTVFMLSRQLIRDRQPTARTVCRVKSAPFRAVDDNVCPILCRILWMFCKEFRQQGFVQIGTKFATMILSYQ